MARTQAADYEEKRVAILDRAARLFAAKGFAGASLSDLAAACKTSKSLIYHYYPSKEAILFAVMNGHMDDLLTAIDEGATDDPHTALQLFSRTLLRLYAGAADRQKVLLYELGGLPKAERGEIIAKERRLIAFAEAILARAHPALARDRKRLRAQAMLFFGMLNWTHTWLKPAGGISRNEVADMAARLAAGSA